MIIDCDQHDWVEIFCLRRQLLLLNLLDGTALTVRATDTRNTAEQEYLLCETASGERAIPLLAIASIQPLHDCGQTDGEAIQLKLQEEPK
ncbi:Rho-binding antiterminator [Alkalimonas sp.]|uniref:Rho-binding antiterminator n=1 Tax=Alkalimonas sp. TaxID=1872453 RepID=UPI00263A7C15|nr:Rho-binding antiterminator [Alkalimonas sp.]MCC5826328.1 transcriptional antiterminator [Alkalimonas sp.]